MTSEERNLKRVYSDLLADIKVVRRSGGKLHWLRGAMLALYFWGVAHALRAPGLKVHRDAAIVGLRLLLRSGRRSRLPQAYSLMFSPMDSVRYFEFDFARRAAGSLDIGRYLDVSSPRLFPLLLLSKNRKLRAEMVNPDAKDLNVTRRLFVECGVAERCQFHECVVEELPFESESFDTITCISVLEHIPGDQAALEKMWELLKPGGRLLLSVPCAAEAFEEFVNVDEYSLLAKDENGFVFGQRFYDRKLLEERVLAVTGDPVCSAVYGERRCGTFFADRREKLRGYHSFWREPYEMGRQYRYYSRIEELPGIGVVGMEFVKG